MCLYHRERAEEECGVQGGWGRGGWGDDDKYDDSDLSEDMWRLRQMQKQELNKVLCP